MQNYQVQTITGKRALKALHFEQQPGLIELKSSFLAPFSAPTSMAIYATPEFIHILFSSSVYDLAQHIVSFFCCLFTTTFCLRSVCCAFSHGMHKYVNELFIGRHNETRCRQTDRQTDRETVLSVVLMSALHGRGGWYGLDRTLTYTI